ncbi:MFS transporter [Mobilicoccus pelagius]|uniref:Putative major facilitator superfamily transporter n=1 Tax=Mobilicoccus pelagius NBRC 104925 TaxID=1089455 RepID=H5UPP1_9MICO|nr:MFS transporter [Mobilicoccus pelagius]GAB47699.1 putative major facilitator superfamily transporter [Mobilicoccus pelagius NBRC 104925]
MSTAGAATPLPDDAPFEGHLPGSAGYRRIAVALFLAGVVTFALLYSTQPILPLLSSEFGLDAGTAALSVSVATAGLGVALLVAGPMSEILGRTPLMHASLFAASLVSLAGALAPGWSVLLGLRLVEGIVLAGLPAVAMAYLAEEVHPSATARAAGLYIGGTAIGGMSGRLVTGAIAEVAGWRAALLGIGLVGLACAVAVRVLLPASRGFTPAPASTRHLLATARAILRDPAYWCLFAIGGTAMGAFVGVFNAMSYRFMAPPYDYSVGVVGLVFLTYAVGSVSSTYAGRAASRFGQRTVAPICAVVMLAGLLGTWFEPIVVVAVFLTVMTAGFFALHGVASGWVAARAARGSAAKGQASSGYLFTYYAGSSVFGALAGHAWESGGWDAVVLLCAGLVGLALLLTLALRRIPALP